MVKIHPYQSLEYASAFSDQYDVLSLMNNRFFALKRPIDNTEYCDATACYPLCPMNEDIKLTELFAELTGLISFVWVSDIFMQPSKAVLMANCDHVNKFKQHYYHDPSLPISLSKHHRYEIRRAQKVCEVRPVPLIECLDTWLALYNGLIKRHQLTGIHCFSESYFKNLCRVPGLLTIAAFHDNQIIAQHVWLQYEDKLYSHLAASRDDAYALGASYAIYDFMLSEYGQHCTIDFGGGSGILDDDNNGLARFKRGFANSQASNFLCGKVLNNEVYQQLNNPDNVFFPGYR